VQTKGSAQQVKNARMGNTKILKLRNECTIDKVKKAADEDNFQMGLLNVYLNGYAGRLGCSTKKGHGDIKIDYSTFVQIRHAVAAKTLNVFEENPEQEQQKPEEEKKKGYNYGGYIP